MSGSHRAGPRRVVPIPGEHAVRAGLAALALAGLMVLAGCDWFTGPDGKKPAAPRSLKIEAASLTSVVLTWTDASSNETGFVIEMDPYGPGEYAEIGRVGENVTTFTVTALDPDDNNGYRVFARNADGVSEPTASKRYRIYGVTVGHIAEDFSALNHNLAQVDLYDYEGNVILLNFAASW